jgi:uncharacterized protein
MSTRVSFKRSPFIFFLLVFVLSFPLWLAGSVRLPLPVNLPFGALMTFCPIIAASILVYREDKFAGIKRLLKLVFNREGTRLKVWYFPVFFLMPVLMFLSYWVMRIMQLPLPKPHIPFMMAPVFFVMYFIAAVGEETGWMGYAISPMLERWSALRAGLIMGVVWATWHIVPDIEANHDFVWIAGQFLSTVAMRIIIIWVYCNTKKSILAAIVLHTMANVSWSLFPNFGSNCNPVVTGPVTALAALVIIFLWGSKTLSQYRYARASLT